MANELPFLSYGDFPRSSPALLGTPCEDSDWTRITNCQGLVSRRKASLLRLSYFCFARKTLTTMNTQKQPRHVGMFTASTAVLKFGSCFALLVFSVTATLFAEASKLPNGMYPYNTFMIPLAVEACKLTASTLFLLRERRSVLMSTSMVTFADITTAKTVMFAVPAFCYFISNNCMFFIIRDLGPSTFQVTNNLKILSTGVLMRVFLGRTLSWLKWKALIILVIGSMVTQLNTVSLDEPRSTSVNGTTFAYSMVCVSAFAAGAGGVFSERLLKSIDRGEINDSIHWQNVQLYSFGALFGIFSLYTNQVDVSKGLFAGFNAFACATVAALAICGLLVSFILKHIDNVAKCFVAALSMICVALLDTAIKHEPVPLHLILGILLTCIAVEQYNLSD